MSLAKNSKRSIFDDDDDVNELEIRVENDAYKSDATASDAKEDDTKERADDVDNADDNASVYSDELDNNADDDRRSAQARRRGKGSGRDQTRQYSFMHSDGDLDEFLTRVYEYYVYGGLAAYVVDRVGQVVKIVFIGAIAFFLLGCIDYDALWAALASSDLASMQTIVDFNSFVGYRGISFWYWPFFIALICYLVWTLALAVRGVRAMVPIRDFYRYVLGVRHIGTVEWSTVAERLAESKQVRKGVFSRDTNDDGDGGDDCFTNELHIVNRIMRRQNFMIALVNCDALALQLNERSHLTDAWNPLMARSTPSGLADLWRDDDNYYYERRTSEPLHPVLTRTLQFALERTLFDFAFEARSGGALRPELARMATNRPVVPTSTAELPEDEPAAEKQSQTQRSEKVRSEKVPLEDDATAIGDNDVLRSLGAALAKKYRVAAIVGLLLSPFVLAFLIADFFLQHGESLKSRPSSLFGMRNWSNEAKWLFRDFNELDHYFRRRLARSYEPALAYCSNFASPTIGALARTLQFIVGALLTLLVLFALLDGENSMTQLHVAFGRSALWWMGLLAAALAGLRSLGNDSNSATSFNGDKPRFDPAQHLGATAEHTHYFPHAWRGSEHSAVVRDDFLRLFAVRIWLSVRELLSVLFTPYLLFFVLPERATATLRFLVNNTEYVNGVGSVCRFASLRLARDGDCSYAASTSSFAAASSFPASGRGDFGDGAKYGKMEASFVNFNRHYGRHWRDGGKERDLELGDMASPNM
jgi:hypothetical protein